MSFFLFPPPLRAPGLRQHDGGQRGRRRGDAGPCGSGGHQQGAVRPAVPGPVPRRDRLHPDPAGAGAVPEGEGPGAPCPITPPGDTQNIQIYSNIFLHLRTDAT